MADDPGNTGKETMKVGGSPKPFLSRISSTSSKLEKQNGLEQTLEPGLGFQMPQRRLRDKTPTPCCHSFLAFVLKFLNFLQAFVGLSIVLYSVYMLSEYYRHPVPSPPPTPFPPNFHAVRVPDHSSSLNFAAEVGSGLDDGLLFNTLSLPAPWFIYVFMGLGIVMCCITCIGYIAAEAINGCCLCFYMLFTTVLLLLEGALLAFIAIDHHWEKDLPFDPTGELDSLLAFIEENFDICMWVSISVLITQAVSMLVAIILRTLVSGRRVEEDIEGDYNVRGKTQEPLLNPHFSQTFGSNKDDGKGAHSDIWSSRIREKYGLDSSDVRNNLLDQGTSTSTKSQ
ncbi:hypothetical protein NMG60_11034585 [Bertholletia excelsa]